MSAKRKEAVIVELHLWNGVDIVLRHPERLWILLLLPALWFLIIWEARLRASAWQSPWHRLDMPVAVLPRLWKRILWWFLVSIAGLLLIVSSTVPEKIHTDWDRMYEGVRLTFLVDTSWSQKGGEDVKPNRLTASKDFIRAMITMLRHDPDLKGRYILALIPFAGTAQPFFAPPTTSFEDILSSLGEIDENTVSKQGTSLWAALRAYEELLLWHPPRSGDMLDVALLISDGDKEEGRGGEMALIPEVARAIQGLSSFRAEPVFSGGAAEKILWKIVINTVGMGEVTIDEQGNRVAVPVELVIRDGAGNFVDFYRRDPNDPRSPIEKSRLDEETLMWIARLGMGEYTHFKERERVLTGVKKLVLEHRRVSGEIPKYQYEPIWNWLLVPAFVLFYFLFGFGTWIPRLFFWLARRAA